MSARSLPVLLSILLFCSCGRESPVRQEILNKDNDKKIKPPSKQESNYLIIIYWEHVDLDGSEGEHIYMKIDKNGEYQFEDRIVTTTSHPNKIEYTSRHGIVSPSLIDTIHSLLAELETIDLLNEYAPTYHAIDSLTKLGLSLTLNKEVKTVKLINFSLSGERRSSGYPKSLISLLCAIEKIRSSSSYSVSPTLQKGCAKYLISSKKRAR